MARKWRFQFGLRTLMLAMLVLGILPWIVLKVREARERQFWNALEESKRLRDESLAKWRTTYDRWQQGNATIRDESDARQRYFDTRSQVERTVRAVNEYYDSDEKQIGASLERFVTQTSRSTFESMPWEARTRLFRFKRGNL
jgi:hypothetical protein